MSGWKILAYVVIIIAPTLTSSQHQNGLKPYTTSSILDEEVARYKELHHQLKIIEIVLNITMTGFEIIRDLFYFDRFIGPDIHFNISLPTTDYKYFIQIIDPKWTFYNATETISNSQYVMYKFQILGEAMVGMYRLRIELPTLRTKRKADKIKITVDISSGDKKGKRKINPSGMLSTIEVELMNSKTQVFAYVDLTTCGLKPKETVKANLTLTPAKGKKTNIEMADDGLGPDSLVDQIFSSAIYAKDLKTVGLFSFSATVLIVTVNKDKVLRTVDLGALRVVALAPGKITDKIAPSRISFFKVSVKSNTENKIILIFTAPGNDGMRGNISCYEVMVNWTDSHSIIKQQNLTHSVQPRSPVTLQIDLTPDNVMGPFQVSVRGVDPVGNDGEWSMVRIQSFNSSNSSILATGSYDIISNKQPISIPVRPTVKRYQVVASSLIPKEASRSINWCFGIQFVFMFVCLTLIR